MLQGENLAAPGTVRRLIHRYQLQSRQSLGQNFLVDGNIADRIVRAAELAADDRVLEIGPGLGALTQRLLLQAREVVAVEIDRRLCQVLEEVLGHCPNLRIVCADARTLDFSSLFPPGARRKAVANLPYYATSPLIFRLLETTPPFALIVVMVQREVAERMMASPGGKDYGVLSVNVQFHSRVEWIATVPPSVFLPRPDVESAVVRLIPRKDPYPVPPAAFARVVRAAFSQRRKTLRNALRAGFPADAVDEALAEAGIDGSRRAETLTVEEFAALSRAIADAGGAGNPAGLEGL